MSKGRGRSAASLELARFLWCPVLLSCIWPQAKAARAGPGVSPQQCYIRVSVGLPSGCSPGIPYVMEIWPPGHFSPIHNHGNSFGIVRMLHGSLTGHHSQSSASTHEVVQVVACPVSAKVLRLPEAGAVMIISMCSSGPKHPVLAAAVDLAASRLLSCANDVTNTCSIACCQR